MSKLDLNYYKNVKFKVFDVMKKVYTENLSEITLFSF